MHQAVGPDWDVSVQAARSRARHRRARTAKSVVALVLAAVALCVVVIWQRNWVRLKSAREQFEEHLPGLVETVQATGTLPLVYPPPAPGELTARPTSFTYIDSTMVRYYRSSQEAPIIAYSPAVRLILGPDQQVAAIKEGNEIRVAVMGADRLRRRLVEQERRVEAAAEEVRKAGPQLP